MKAARTKAPKSKFEAAKDAINALFNDTSASKHETRADLIDLQDEIDILLDALANDIRKEEE